MSEENPDEILDDEQEESSENIELLPSHDKKPQSDVLGEMYKDYFLDYASYVILERAVPAVEDGLKPVQRRILHAMYTMDDGRYNKVANIIGQTMQFHPHGDASINDALVNMGQKDLLIDCQGNWGDVRTGDNAAASRYIEARLSKFAKAVLFNPKITIFQLSYDGRKKEPVTLPVKFPLLLSHGVEGIAVGLATKILPHNFIEIIEGCIKILKGEEARIYPDFLTGGSIDVSNYNGGKRGGKVRIRAKIEITDRKILTIKEIPFGTTTGSLIESIVKASNKNKIKIKKVTDNTAEHVEIQIELPPGTSPEMTVDALYAFTDCESSISPNACVIVDGKPVFITVEELLKISTLQTKDLLEWELRIEEEELMEKWHFASLEKIFIENKIYQRIEECETWEAVLTAIDEGLKPFIKNFYRAVTTEDIIRLTEIKIKRISKFNKFEADDLILKLENELKETRYHLNHLVEYAINYYSKLLKDFGKGRERKTEIIHFDNISAVEVVVNNAKLYLNREEGFMGSALKKDEFIEECSDMDDIIVFHKDGSFLVTKIAEKVFIGKNPLHVSVWKKQNERMIYNVVYADLEAGINYVKRFPVSAITRDKKYPIADGVEKSIVHHFSANPNGEAELIQVRLTQSCTAKKKEFEYDFSQLAVKGRGARGNVLTKYPIRKITIKSKGESTLGALKIWYDPSNGRLNTSEYGKLLGAFEEEDRILAFYKNGSYEMTNYDLHNRFEPKDIYDVFQYDAEQIITAVYYEAEKGFTYAKRFKIETSSLNSKFDFFNNNHKDSELLFLSIHPEPIIKFNTKNKKSEFITLEIKLNEVTELMGWKAVGSKISDFRISNLEDISPAAEEEIQFEIEEPSNDNNDDDPSIQITLF
jgi:topoisomerase-4 subunit A